MTSAKIGSGAVGAEQLGRPEAVGVTGTGTSDADSVFDITFVGVFDTGDFRDPGDARRLRILRDGFYQVNVRWQLTRSGGAALFAAAHINLNGDELPELRVNMPVPTAASPPLSEHGTALVFLRRGQEVSASVEVPGSEPGQVQAQSFLQMYFVGG